jgi:glucose-6-phosphate 1-epimerase
MPAPSGSNAASDPGIASAEWQGLDCLRLSSPHGMLLVARFGAHVLSWVPADGTERLWLSPTPRDRLPAGLPIRGGIPLCWPWFARQHRADTDPQHGVARTALWEPAERTHDAAARADRAAGEPMLRLVPRPWTASQRAVLGPAAALEVALEIGLGPALQMRMFTRNTGSTAVPLTQAFHTYFAVPEVTTALVTGLAGTFYLDKRDGFARKLQDGEPSLAAPLDRIYEGTAGHYRLNGTATARGVAIDGADSSTAVLWNPGAADAGTMVDVPGDSWRRFVCLEVAHASTQTLMLAPGTAVTLTQTLQPI